MKILPFPGFLAGAVSASLLLSAAGLLPGTQDKTQDPHPGAADMAKMMETAKRFTQPGGHHKQLARFLGKWNSETRMFMGGRATPAEKGTAEFSWLMEGRWLKFESSGSMMGMDARIFSILGYDNFKQSFVSMSVQSIDTAMLHYEGDLDPGGKALLAYGTLDEYLTGEHDKMVKYVWRFVSDDHIVFEVHDLPIGENNTKVVEVTFTRKA